MRQRLIPAILVLALALPGLAIADAEVTFSGRTWTLRGDETAANYKVETFRGEDALRMRNGNAVLSDLDFENGTIELDLATTGHRSFVGLSFRVDAASQSGEYFYLRPHNSERFDAMQYTPIEHGIAAWQLYPEHNASLEIPTDRWLHVKLVVAGSRLSVYFDHASTPTLTVSRLARGCSRGQLVLRSGFPGGEPADLFPTAFANLRIEPDITAATCEPEVAPPASSGFISRWSLSPVFPGDGDTLEVVPGAWLASAGWQTAESDAQGRVNLARYGGLPTDARRGTVLARAVIHAAREQIVKLNIGFSDRASIFLDGRLLFSGDNTYRSRSERYLGVMTIDNDALYLPLHRGANELLAAVTESFGGWGLTARLEAASGLRVEAAPPPESPVSAAAEVASVPGAQVDALMAPWAASGSPGCAVGVVQDGMLVHARGYGLANLDHGIPITPQTAFDIGSTSKQFTAVAIALLAERGELSLDDDIRIHLPEMPDYGSPITIRHLLHHTSGIRDYLTVMSLAGLQEENVYTLDDVVQMIARQKGLNFAPGEEYLYSNSGYMLLAEIVERVTGQTTGTFLRDNVFLPLGMHDTLVYEDRHDIIPRRATGYSPAEEGEGFVVDHVYNFAVPGDGQIYTTVEDLQRWDQAFYSDAIGSPGFMDRLLVHGQLNDGEELDYAMGLQVVNHRGLRVVRHSGAWGGFRSELMRFPTERFSVICLCNVGAAAPWNFAEEIADIYLAARLEKPAASSEDAAAATVRVPTPAELATYTGTFLRPSNGDVWSFAAPEGVLTLRLMRTGTTFDLEPIGPARFRIPGVSSINALDFSSFAAGDRRLQVERPRETERYEEVVLATPSPSALVAYAGDYRSEELDVVYHIRATETGLEIVRERDDEIRTLAPGREDIFLGGSVILDFERDAAGAITGLRLDAGRVKNIVFTRLPVP